MADHAEHTPTAEKVSASERKLWDSFVQQLDPPDDILSELERGSDQRSFIKDCMLLAPGADSAPAVATNYVYRYHTASMSDLFPRDPTFALRPRDKMWGQQGPPPELYAFSETVEKLVNYKSQQPFTNFARGLAHEALTVASAWGKIIWHEDYSKDAIGVSHSNELDYTYARYVDFYTRYEAKQFAKDSAEYQIMEDISDTIKEALLDELDGSAEQNPIDADFADLDPRVQEGQRISDMDLVNPDMLPEIPVFQDFLFDLIEQEDMRWDWGVNRFDNWRQCTWQAHRVRMAPDVLAAKYNLDLKDITGSLPSVEDNNAKGQTTQEHRDDIEENNDPKTIDVWERWDRVTGMVYVFTEHLPFFLDKYEPVTWSGFFMMFPLQFNPVAGEFIGISDVDMQRGLQDEINEKRSNEREYISAAMPRFAVSADAFDDDNELDLMAQARPFEYVQLKTTEDPSKKIHTFQAQGVDRLFFDTMQAQSELGIMAARPEAAIGGANAGVTATQTAFSNEQLGGQVSQRRKIFEDYLGMMGRAMIEILIQRMDPMEVRAVVGEGGMWPESEREAMLTHLDLEVTTSLDNDPNAQNFLANFQIIQQVAREGGRAPNLDKILPKLAREVLKMDIPIEEWYPVDPNMLNGERGGPAGTPGPNPGSQGQPQTGTPSMAQLPGMAQVAQGAAGG